MKRIAAGLILFTKDPRKGLVAVLSKRGHFDYEKFKPEKFPGLYELTASGGIHSGEHLIDGLLREVEEELGNAAAKLIVRYEQQFHQVAHYERGDLIVYNYAVYIPHFPLVVIHPHRSSDGILVVSAAAAKKIKALDRAHGKQTPMPDDKTIWMFPDQLEGLKKGFTLFCVN